MGKRIVSLLLAVLMMTTLLPVQVWGVEMTDSDSAVTENEISLDEEAAIPPEVKDAEEPQKNAASLEQPATELAENNIATTIATIVASGYCGGEGDGKNLTWTLDSEGVLTISGKGKMEHFNYYFNEIPWYESRGKILKVVINAGVTSIGGDAFYLCNNLTNITIPDSITSIESGAFEGCGSLTNVSIPGGITYIESHTFADCNSLTSITIPDSVTDIEDYAFSGCSSLTSISIPSGVASIEDGTFKNCNNLTSITIPDSVTSIGDHTFEECGKLTCITLPNSITHIGRHAFDGCSSLVNMIIPNNVHTIGAWAFSACNSLTSISVPNGVTYIGDFAFRSCSNLTSIFIPSSVTSIGEYAFRDCISLTSVSIPNSITHIEESTFRGCSDLTSVSIPSSLTSIGAFAFDGCDGLTKVNITDLTAWCNIDFEDNPLSYAHNLYLNDELLTNLAIPSSVTSIAADAFSYCTSLTSITIPSSVTSIGSDAFWGCTSLANVYYTGSEAKWSAIDVGYGNEDLTSATIHYNSKDASELPKLTFSEQEYQAVAGRNVHLSLQLVDPAGNCKELAESLVLTSSNSEVFPIDKNNILCEPYGDITADIAIYGKPTVSSGTATITATLPDGTTAACRVVVTPKANSVTLKKDSYEIKVGDTGALYLTVDNTEQLKSIQLNWRSSDERVVSLETSGIINIILDGTAADSISAKCSFTAKKPGTATITCTLVNGPSVTCNVTVYSAEDAENNRTIKSNEYNAAQYNESELTEALKQIDKLKADWKKKYKKYTTAVDKALKPLDKESDIQAALRSKENAAKMLRQADKAVKDKSNMMLTFQAGFPEEWKDVAYQILCDIFENHIDDTIGFDSIDFSKEISANASVINEICSKMWDESSSWKSHPYSKNKAVLVSYSCFGFLASGFGSMSFKRGGATYTVVICSNKSIVQKSMATYLNSCYSMGQRTVQNARKALINDMLALTGANAVGEALFKEQVKKGLNAFESHLQEVGLGGLTDTADKIYDYYNTIKGIYNTINKSTPENLATAKKRLESDLLKLSTLDFGTAEASKVNNALTELKKASQKLYNALNELLTNGKLSKTGPLDWLFGKKTQVKCPVDVEIYRGSELIGYVSETECWYDASIYVEENDDAKIIYSSAGDELSIKLTGTDYGSLSVTVEEYANGSPVERLNYYDIDLHEGIDVSFVIPTASISDVKDSMTIVSDGTAFTANEYISADTDASIRIDVEKSIDEAGTISGDGVYVRGDAVVLRASANSDYLFTGWYDEKDRLVSSLSSFEFTASSDSLLYAKFINRYALGDVNRDGSVDVNDMQRLYELLTTTKSDANFDEYRLNVADLNHDSVIDVYDLQWLYEHASGINPF